MNNYCIYAHIAPNGNVYIGQTCQKPERRGRYNGTGYLGKNKGTNDFTHRVFAKAILKYGGDNFEHKILFTELSLLEANMIEEDLVYYYKKIGKSYNCTDGGGGTKGLCGSEATRVKQMNQFKEHPRKGIKGRKPGTIGKKIYQYDKHGNFIAEYDYVIDAAKAVGCTDSNISVALHSKARSAAGFLGRYEKTENPAQIKNVYCPTAEQMDRIRNMNAKPALQYSLDGEFIKEGPSASEAARALGVSISCVRDCCNERQKTTKGFTFRGK